MDKVYKSQAQLATGYTGDETVTLSDEKAPSPFEVNTRFINTIESMNSIPVMLRVSYRLILHDLESGNPFRVLNDPDEQEFDLSNKQELEKIKKLFNNRLKQFKNLNSFNPSDQVALLVLEAYEYDYESLIDNFKISRQSSSDFISIDFTSENPELSAFAVNALCQEFLLFNKTLKTDRSSESIVFLKNLMEEKRKVRDEKATALNKFKIDNNVFNYGAESENKITQISDYQLTKETEEKNIVALELSLATLDKKIQSYGKLNNDELLRVNQRILELRRQINELNGSIDEANRSKLNQLRDELQLEIGRLETINKLANQEEVKILLTEREGLALQLKIAKSNLASVSESLRRLKNNVSGLSNKEAKLTSLQREVDAASEEFLSAQEKYNAAKSKTLIIGSTLRQILEGQPSSEPEPSKAIILIGLAGVSSFILCVLVILTAEFMDFTIRTPSRLERQTGMRNIGTINLVNMQIFDLHKVFEGKSKNRNMNLFIHFMRKLRFEIQHSNGKILLVTGTQAGVGKSFVIICLSYTLSLLSKRILIIDTNFKSSTLTEILIPKLDKSKLLKKGSLNYNYLLAEETGQANGKNKHEVDENATVYSSHQNNGNIIHKTKFKDVDIIGNFGGLDSPSEIFAGKDFNEMLRNLALQYDYIILEGPSMNDYSDTKELIDFVDKVIPVFGADRFVNHQDIDSIKYLKSIKSKLLGSVLNKAKLKDLSV